MAWLERGFEDEEASKGLVVCAGDEAAGLDGFKFTLLSVHMECY